MLQTKSYGCIDLCFGRWSHGCFVSDSLSGTLQRTRPPRGFAAVRDLDTPPEPAFDRVTRLASAVFQVPIVRMALLDADRQWIKSCVGPLLQDPSRELAFCAHTIL